MVQTRMLRTPVALRHTACFAICQSLRPEHTCRPRSCPGRPADKYAVGRYHGTAMGCLDPNIPSSSRMPTLFGHEDEVHGQRGCHYKERHEFGDGRFIPSTSSRFEEALNVSSSVS